MTNRTVALVGVGTVLGVAALYAGSARLSGHSFGFGKSNGCTVEQRPAEGDVTPIHVECRWPIPAERLDGLLRDVVAQGRIFSNLAESALVEKSDDHLLVRQVQRATGMTDREVILEWRVEQIPQGHRYRFEKARDQSALSGKRVEVAQNTGFWEVMSDGDGSRVTYELRYLPGGDLSPFLVRMFQSSAVNGAMSELRNAAESQMLTRRE